ncbi:epoxyqueuosine reductase QueH [Anaerovorax odorimutans]|uniref:epoxyqueuosine reductase QueH n=1 Tax=Anaerovorax odorimutans TaxID=109327 RepID=UPI0003FE1F5B|nr:epoxyqueuosine reductase QueH [Anaerovorax odorimutans]
MKKCKENSCMNSHCEIRNLNNDSYISINDLDDVSVIKPQLLLHSCCGPCSTSVIEKLVYSYDITVFFYNPNITDTEEYKRRKDAQISFINQYNGSKDSIGKIAFMEGSYDVDEFYKVSAGLEKEPEGGRRCVKCFEMRLEKTAETASLSGYNYFATTLTVSPYKNYAIISKIGTKLGVKYGLVFLNEDFKKKDGYKRSIELSKKYNLYRQKYCGCKFAQGGKIKCQKD